MKLQQLLELINECNYIQLLDQQHGYLHGGFQHNLINEIEMNQYRNCNVLEIRSEADHDFKEDEITIIIEIK